jgi:hypothetical protein
LAPHSLLLQAKCVPSSGPDCPGLWSCTCSVLAKLATCTLLRSALRRCTQSCRVQGVGRGARPLLTRIKDHGWRPTHARPSPGMPTGPFTPPVRCRATQPLRSHRRAAAASMSSTYGIVRCCISFHSGAPDDATLSHRCVARSEPTPFEGNSMHVLHARFPSALTRASWPLSAIPRVAPSRSTLHTA